MEQETYICGYCRLLDGPRTVEIILEDGKITECDCCYGNCIHQGSCPVAKEIASLGSPFGRAGTADRR